VLAARAVERRALRLDEPDDVALLAARAAFARAPVDQERVRDLSLLDVIDVGVFSGTKEHLKRLYLAKHRFSIDHSTVEVEVNEKPTFAGIDPYNKLIDRNPEDNLIAVEQKK